MTVSERVATGPSLAAGSFRGLAHPTEGTARIVERCRAFSVSFGAADLAPA